MVERPSFLDNARLADGRLVCIAIDDGTIAAIQPAGARGNEEAIDLGGALLLPGMVEGHLHLDKSFIGDRWHPHRPYATLAEAIRNEREELARAAPIVDRATALVALAVANGSSYIRSHVDVDPQIGLRNLEAILAVRERMRDVVQIEIVAFPQTGVMVNPGAIEVMEAALEAGADLISGIDPAGFDGDVEGQLDALFGLAERRGVGIDLHLHDPGTLGLYQLEQVARRTEAAGMLGRVAVSHAYCLGMVGMDDLAQTAVALARAGVSIMTNAPGNHAFPPVKALRTAGVNVFGGTDNVRDAWWPYGDADMLSRAAMIGYRSGFYTDDELEMAFDVVSAAGARAIGVERYGVTIGAPAHLMAVQAEHVPEAVVAHPPRKLVLFDGRVVARDGVFVGG